MKIDIKKISTHQSVCHKHDTYESVCMHCVAETINALIDEAQRMRDAIRDLQRLDTEG